MDLLVMIWTIGLNCLFGCTFRLASLFGGVGVNYI